MGKFKKIPNVQKITKYPKCSKNKTPELETSQLKQKNPSNSEST